MSILIKTSPGFVGGGQQNQGFCGCAGGGAVVGLVGFEPERLPIPNRVLYQVELQPAVGPEGPPVMPAVRQQLLG